MFGPKVHEGRFGRFYSAWALSSCAYECAETNSDVYGCLVRRLDIRSGAWQHGGGDEAFSYERVSRDYGRSSYRVTERPSWMTLEEAALVCDHGSLVFGFRADDGDDTITIYED